MVGVTTIMYNRKRTLSMTLIAKAEIRAVV